MGNKRKGVIVIKFYDDGFTEYIRRVSIKSRSFQPTPHKEKAKRYSEGPRLEREFGLVAQIAKSNGRFKVDFVEE